MPSIFPAGRRSAAPDTLLAAAFAAAFAAGAFAQQSFDVTMRDGLLSIRANGTSAAELAAALAEETGIRVVVTGDAEQGLTTEIVEEPLVKAIALLSPNHLLVRGEGGAGAPLLEIVLMLDEAGGGGTGGEEMEFLPSGAPADEIEPGEGSPELYGDGQTPVEQEQPLDEPPGFSGELPYDEQSVPDAEFVDDEQFVPDAEFVDDEQFAPDEEFVDDEEPFER